MRRISFKPDIPFSREDANRYLPWVIGLMVCLAGLFLAASLSIHYSSRAAGRLNVNSFQIYVPYERPDKAAMVQKIRNLLLANPMIDRVQQLRAQDLGQLVAPWTGSARITQELPLPEVLEATLSNQADRIQEVAAIKSQIQSIDGEIEVESYQQWVDQLMQFAGMLRLLAMILALLVIVGLVAIVVMTSRTSLRLHFKTVKLLHHVGAQNDYIVRQFVTNGAWMTLRGAVPGASVAAILYTAMAYASDVLASPLLPDIGITSMHVVLFVALPFLTACVAYISIRMTVQSMIEHMH